MAKKEKTVQQEKKSYQRKQWALFIGEFVAGLSPFVAIGIANYEKYFVEYNGTRMSIGFFMALAVMGIAIWGVAKQKMKDSFVTFLIKWAVIAFIFTMLGQMITDIAYIMWFGLIGLVVAYGADKLRVSYNKKIEAIDKASEKATEEDLVERLKEEKKEKKNEKNKKEYDGTTV